MQFERVSDRKRFRLIEPNLSRLWSQVFPGRQAMEDFMTLSMNSLVAASAKGQQILGRVITKLTSRLNVVNLQSLDRATRLAAPTIPFEDFAAELAIGFGIKPQARAFRTNLVQVATRILSMSCSRSGTGRLSTRRVIADRRAS
jgi:hypothetical protein